jgi:quercetin dioxygenase-like cupin family protein
MVDDLGHPLHGIRGRSGVAATVQNQHRIGLDLIELAPGTAFPLHVHAGDHLLYVLAGQGLVLVDAAAHAIQAGDCIYIPAEYPHSVSNPPGGGEALVLLTVGYPHRHVGASDRMRVVSCDDQPGG